MKFSPEHLRRVLSVLDAEDRTFRNLVRVAGLRPDRDLCGADLRRVDFGADDYRGFDFAGADLRGANLAQARGLNAEMFAAAFFDETTCWPQGLAVVVQSLDIDAVARDRILAGQAPPTSWLPFIRQLDLSAPFDEWRSHFRTRAPIAEGTALAFRRVELLSGFWALRAVDLSCTQVSDVAPLANLRNLQSLNLSNTQVHEVTPLRGLTELRSLNLLRSKVSDVTPLAGLTGLQRLDLSETNVSDISALAGLSEAKILWKKPAGMRPGPIRAKKRS